METLVEIILEGCSLLELADSGSQVNMMMLEFVGMQGYLVLLLDKLVDIPAFGGTGQSMHLSLRIHNCEAPGEGGGRVWQDVVFLVVPDESAFSRVVSRIVSLVMAPACWGT